MIYIPTADGHNVPAELVSSGSERLVILSHGIATNKDEDGIYTTFAEEILAPEFDSIRFDFRGHGHSTLRSEEATIAGEILDFMAVVRWSRQQGYKNLFHVGTSFGASITLLCAARFSFHDFSSFVFWNPVINYDNTFINSTVSWGKEFFSQKTLDELAYKNGIAIPETNFVIGPRMAMELLNFHPDATIWPLGLPLLVIHGDKDSAVPCYDALEYQKRNDRVVTLRIIQGVDHGFDDKISDVYELTAEWFRLANKTS